MKRIRRIGYIGKRGLAINRSIAAQSALNDIVYIAQFTKLRLNAARRVTALDRPPIKAVISSVEFRHNYLFLVRVDEIRSTGNNVWLILTREYASLRVKLTEIPKAKIGGVRCHERLVIRQNQITKGARRNTIVFNENQLAIGLHAVITDTVYTPFHFNFIHFNTSFCLDLARVNLMNSARAFTESKSQGRCRT
nr:hypothetical protein THEDDIDL_THEDDIDL_CDS_0008 [Microvirus sp.]